MTPTKLSQVPSCTLVVPLYGDPNCGHWLEEELLALKLEENVNVLIVDNGSDLILNPDVMGLPNVSSMRLEDNRGFGGAVKCANKVVEPGRAICWIPGNGKVSIRDSLTWLAQVHESPVILGKALRERSNRVQIIKSKVAEIALAFITGTYWRDFGGAPTYVDSSIRNAFFLDPPTGIEIEMYTLVFSKVSGIPLARPKSPYGDRKWGKSTWRKGIQTEVRLLAALAKTVFHYKKLLGRQQLGLLLPES